MKRKHWFKGPIFIILFVIALAAASLITKLLWNALIPELFSGPVITFWQAAGLLILSKLLLGGFGRGHRKHFHNTPGEIWKRKWRAKMESMTPEEREKFRSKCRHYFDEEETVNTGKESV